MKETRDWWNETSGYFQNEAALPADIHYGPGCPDADSLSLLADVDVADIVELGCGGGQCSIGFARRGAASVIGVDLSTEQLAYAERLSDEYDAGIRLLVGDVTALPLASDSYDVAFSAYAFQWVDDIESCFAEAARVLRSGGRFVFSLPHPFYQRFDPDTGRIERSYFDTGEERIEHDGLSADQLLFHRRVSDIHAALVDAGFTVDRLMEPGTDDPDDYEELWASSPELMAEVPRTLVVRATLRPDLGGDG